MTSNPPSVSPTPGDLRAEYRQGVGGYILLFGLLAAFFIAATWFSITSVPRSWIQIAFFGLFTLAWIGLGGWGIVRMPDRILLYDELILVERLLGREQFNWDTITLVTVDAVQQHGILTLRLKLQSQDGRKLVFGAMPTTPKQKAGVTAPRIGIGQLIEIVLEMSAPARYEEAVRRYDGGQPVEFTKFQLSQTGISARKRSISWPMVADIQANDRHMVVKAVGQERPWATFALHELANVDILPMVVAHARGTGFSAFQGIEQTPALEEAGRTSRRQQLISWLLLLLLFIGINGGYIYYRYYTSYRGHRDRGEAAFDRGDYTTALAEFDQAVALSPDYDNGYVDRGRAYAELGRYTEATADYTTAMQLNPDSVRAIAQLGRVLHYQGQFAKAIVLYTSALARDSTYAFAYCGRGESYQRLGRRDAARADYISCRDTAADTGRRAEAERLLAGLP